MVEYGLVGRSLKHSFSQRCFQERFGAEDGSLVKYSLFELSSIDELPSFWAAHPDLAGFNVTIPYKEAIIPYLDRLDHVAASIGAVNCVKREGNDWVGYNTDYTGLVESLRELLGGALPEHALVLGTGGASLAVQYALVEFGIGYDLLSRDPLRGNYTYDNLPTEVLSASKLVINATPVGTYPAVEEAPRLPYAYLTPDHFLLDLVYNPPLTTFLDYGNQRGARTMNGERMLRLQAEASWKIWGLI